MPQWMEEPWAVPAAVAAGVAVLLAIVVVARLLRRKPDEASVDVPDLSINVSKLVPRAPHLDRPHLEVYGVPIRLAVVVVAPVGRDHMLPPNDQMAEFLNQLLPHMQAVIQSDDPAIHRWPAQLSVQGFKHAFFNQVMLPGDHGKGSPWCSVAGKFSIGQHGFLVGLVGAAATNNSLSQIFVEHEGRWLDAVRVKNVPSSE